MTSYQELLKRDGLIFKQDEEDGGIRIEGSIDKEFKCHFCQETFKELVDKMLAEKI